jgi:hypothetical protein
MLLAVFDGINEAAILTIFKNSPLGSNVIQDMRIDPDID